MSEDCVEALLEALAGVVRARKAMEDEIEADLVARLRAMDSPVPWRRIAEVYGTTDEGARRRFTGRRRRPRA